MKRIRAIKEARDAVSAEISELASRGGRFARGVAPEGYAGGYRDALDDVLLLLTGDTMPTRRDYWPKEASDE
jgi:hypothetical protein